MLTIIANNKTKYNQGQIFPFLIAVIVIIIIIAMITVNLGQIGVFKTDVSNAADAAALAGASTLSGYLLGLGLKSDSMCGQMIVAVGAIIGFIIASVFGCIPCLGAAIATYIAYLINQYVSYFLSLEDGKMAWSNAKKTALQYAFQNAGIDEPRPTFKDFLKNAYGITNPDSLSNEQITNYNEIYFKGDDPSADAQTRKKIKDFSQTGFSRFMEENGYWNDAWGEIKPGNISPALLTAGYGWRVRPEAVTNSYKPDTTDHNYKNLDIYDNYVEVEVSANVMYPLQIYNPFSEIFDSIINYLEANMQVPWWLEWMKDAIQWLLSLVSWMFKLLPAGLHLDPTAQNIDNNPIIVTVRRFKKSTDLGLWRFRYGTVEAQASAHVYGEIDADGVKHDIKPALWSNLWSLIQSVGGGKWDWGWFNTQKHLFESELTQVR